MAAAKWQQANGAKKCENGRPKTVRNRRPKSAKMSEKVRKQSKTNAKTVGDFAFCCSFFLPISSGHFAVAI